MQKLILVWPKVPRRDRGAQVRRRRQKILLEGQSAGLDSMESRVLPSGFANLAPAALVSTVDQPPNVQYFVFAPVSGVPSDTAGALPTQQPPPMVVLPVYGAASAAIAAPSHAATGMVNSQSLVTPPVKPVSAAIVTTSHPATGLANDPDVLPIVKLLSLSPQGSGQVEVAGLYAIQPPPMVVLPVYGAHSTVVPSSTPTPTAAGSIGVGSLTDLFSVANHKPGQLD